MGYEIPSGTVNGVNATFTTLGNISNEQLFVNRLLQMSGVDYTISGNTITFLPASLPQTGASIIIWYTTLPTIGSAIGTGVTTLAAVTASAKYRADMVNSSFVSAAEWTTYIQASQQELYGILVQAFGNDYYVAVPFPITTDGVNYLYALPNGTGDYLAFFKLLGVDLKMGGRWVTLKPFNFTERNRHAITSNVPTAGMQLQVWYAPRLTLPINGADPIDGVNGWEEYLTIDAAIKALQKEESDVSVLMAQKQAMLTRIQEEADRRDAGMPATVADSANANGYFSARFYGPSGLRYRLNGNNLWLNPDDSLSSAGGGAWE